MGGNEDKDVRTPFRNMIRFAFLKEGADLFKSHNDDEAAKLMVISPSN